MTPKPMSADTMVERVARALYAFAIQGVTFDADVGSQAVFRDMARAAIEAIGLERLDAEKRLCVGSLCEVRRFAAERTNDAPGFDLIVRAIDTTLSAVGEIRD